MSRLLLGKASVRLCQSLNQYAKLQFKPTVLAPSICIARRPLMFFETGMEHLEEEEDELYEEFQDETELMGSADAPAQKMEHLKMKEWRTMRANKVEGLRSNYKIRGLIDVIYLKRRNKLKQ